MKLPPGYWLQTFTCPECHREHKRIANNPDERVTIPCARCIRRIAADLRRNMNHPER